MRRFIGRKSGKCPPSKHGTSSDKQVSTRALQAEKIIAVMGQLGCGKADLIHHLGRNSWQRPGCAQIMTTKVYMENAGVTLLDTPEVGSRVDGKNLSEADIACYLQEWLQQSNAHLTGILYCQNLDDRRAIRLNLDCFSHICEADEIYPTVLLVGTGERSIMHKELQDREWKDAIEKGAKTYAYMNTRESAEEAIRHMITC